MSRKGVPEDKENQVKRLVSSSGLSLREANRIVYGWSDPSMAVFWQEIWEGRDKKAPQLEQKDAFFLIIKTSFGKDFESDSKLEMTGDQMREICQTFVAGVLKGHIYRRQRTKRPPTPEVLMQSARSELSRLIREDSRLKKRIQREE